MMGRLFPGLRNIRTRELGQRVIREYISDDMALYAAALSFHALLAIFPFLIFLLGLLSTLRIPGFFDLVVDQANLALPADAARVVNDVVATLQEQEHGGLASFGALLAFAAASTGVRALMTALNTAYDISETRAFWKKYLLSFLYTLGFAVLLIIAAGALVLGPQTLEWLSGYVGLGELFIMIWSWLRYPVAVLVLMLIAALVYYVLPNVDQPFRFITPGSAIAVLVWILASVGFSIYVTTFANYNATYGSLGGIVALLFYFFISAAVLLLGAEINAEVFHMKKGPPKPDDTSGVD